MVAKITVTEGEFAGWQTYDLHDTFDVVVGPFYGKLDPDGHMRCAFRAEQKHMNAGGRIAFVDAANGRYTTVDGECRVVYAAPAK